MTRRLLLAVFVLAVCGTALGFLWLAWDTPQTAANPERPPEGRIATRDLSVLRGTSASEKRSSMVSLEEATHTPPVGGTGNKTGIRSTDLVTLHGSVTVIDASGVEFLAESGTMELTAWMDNHGSRMDVLVSNGMWSCNLPGTAWIAVSSMELGGRVALCDLEWDAAVPIPPDRFLALMGRWLPATSLVVRAEDTGLELGHIELALDPPFPGREYQHPGRFHPEEVIEQSARSPIALPVSQLGRLQQPIRLFARSPGYAWGRIDVNLSQGGEQLLILSPGGDLTVSFRGHNPSPGSHLIVWLEGGFMPALDQPLNGETELAIESLAEGHYQIAVQVGEWFENPIALGSELLDVIAGRSSSVFLTLEEAPAPQLASLSGTLIVPDGWNLENLILSFDLQGTALEGTSDHFALHDRDLAQVPGEPPGLYEWIVPEVQVGRWEISLFQPKVAVLVDVGPEGCSDVVIELPPPGRVSLRMLDQETGELTNVDRIHWGPVLPTGVHGSAIGIRRSAETGTFEFLATIGEIVVTTPGGEYASSSKRFVVVQGLNELTMEVRRSLGVLVVLKDGNTVIQWDDEWFVLPERVDGRSGGSGSVSLNKGRLFTVPVSGLYRIEIPPIPGFLPVEPLVVSIQSGPHRILEVQLVRPP